MFIESKTVIRDNGQIRVRIKSLNWDGTRYGLYVDGECVSVGSYEVIKSAYNRY